MGNLQPEDIVDLVSHTATFSHMVWPCKQMVLTVYLQCLHARCAVFCSCCKASPLVNYTAVLMATFWLTLCRQMRHVHTFPRVYSTGMDENNKLTNISIKTISCRLYVFGLNGATLCVNGVSCLLATNIKLTAPNQPTSAEMSLQAMCARVPWNVLNMSNLFYHITTCAFLYLFITNRQNSSRCYGSLFFFFAIALLSMF